MKTKEQQAAYDKIKYEKNKEKIKARTLAHYHINHDASIARKRKYAETHRVAIRMKAKQWALDHPEKIKEWAWREGIKRRHGVTLEQFNSLLSSQNGTCAICGKSPQEGKRLCIDHDHKTGIVRGLLCRNCNAAIGQLGDDPNMLSRAMQYLNQYQIRH